MRFGLDWRSVARGIYWGTAIGAAFVLSVLFEEALR